MFTTRDKLQRAASYQSVKRDFSPERDPKKRKRTGETKAVSRLKATSRAGGTTCKITKHVTRFVHACTV